VTAARPAAATAARSQPRQAGRRLAATQHALLAAAAPEVLALHGKTLGLAAPTETAAAAPDVPLGTAGD
jgi:hypothetical protein